MNFYLTLPSNSPHPGNQTTKFRVNLPKTIELEGSNWQVALVECNMTNSIPNVRKTIREGERHRDTTIIIDWKDDKQNMHRTTATMWAGHYQKPETLARVLNYVCTESLAKDSMTPLIDMKTASPEERRKQIMSRGLLEIFTIDTELRNVFTVNLLPQIEQIQVSKALAFLMGFKTCTFAETTDAPYPYDLRGGTDSIFVYCDIIEPQIVGNTMANLLRVLPVKGAFGEVVNLVWETPIYVKVLKRSFSSIDFCIKDSANNILPIAFGDIILTLHFKQNAGGIRAFGP